MSEGRNPPAGHPEENASSRGEAAQVWTAQANLVVGGAIFRAGATANVAREPTVVLQAAVTVEGGETAEGTLIVGVLPAWVEIIRLIQQDPDLMYTISPRKWEEIIAGAYEQAGFDRVTLTPASGDYGRDIIAVKRGIGSVRVIDQVKAYKSGHLVTADDVRALMGVLHTDGAAMGFLTTTSDFAPKIRTDPLITPLIPSRLELVNGTALSQRLQELLSEREGGR